MADRNFTVINWNFNSPSPFNFPLSYGLLRHLLTIRGTNRCSGCHLLSNFGTRNLPYLRYLVSMASTIYYGGRKIGTFIFRRYLPAGIGTTRKKIVPRLVFFFRRRLLEGFGTTKYGRTEKNFWRASS